MAVSYVNLTSLKNMTDVTHLLLEDFIEMGLNGSLKR
jgi:hypothetical protein